jgi:hypothetical protein
MVSQMIDRLILSMVLGTAGWHGLYPDLPKPPTSSQLMEMGRDKSISNVCAKKKKTQKVKELCAKWAKHE